MVDTLTGLIDKQDNFEVIRDQIALILATESANQQALAIAAAKDPALWKLRVFTERSNPWEQFRDNPTDRSPIVNVWYDNGSFPKGKGTQIERQAHEATYNIDCLGFAVAADDIAGGHKPGDREAAFEVHRAVRLVRNILMSAQNTYLQLRGTVWGRWPDSITVFQPQQEPRSVEQVVGARIAFRVEFNEFAPQFDLETLEFLSVDIKRAEDGSVVAEADFDYLAP